MQLKKKKQTRTAGTAGSGGSVLEKSTGGSVTLGDVARLAGVGTTTVSRALNNPDKVAPKTLEKINQAIELTGYVPNQIAGALASRKSYLVAAIIPSISNAVYAETIKYFSRTLRDSGYQVLLGETDYQEDQEESLVRTILSRKPDGIFFIGINHTPTCRRQLMMANIPVVETWDMTGTPLDLLVGFSHKDVGRALGNFLLKRGIRQFGSVWALDRRAQMRRKGFLDVLENSGIGDSLVYDVPAPTSFGQGREGMSYLFEQGIRTGAVVCSSDTIAHGVLAEARDRGIKIPEDLVVTGFGDLAFAPYTSPPLTTVKFDRQRIGQCAAEILLARMNGDNVPEPIINVGFEIIERETT